MNLPCAFKKRPGSLHFTLLTYDIPIVKKYNKIIVFFSEHKLYGSPQSELLHSNTFDFRVSSGSWSLIVVSVRGPVFIF